MMIDKVLVILCFIPLVFSHGPPGSCTRKGNRFTISNTQCTCFFHEDLTNGNGDYHQCPAPMTFNPQACVCDLPERSVCQPALTDRCGPGDHAVTATGNQPGFCEQNGNRYTIANTKCTCYYQEDLTTGHGGYQHCPETLTFNTQECVCDYPGKSVCQPAATDQCGGTPVDGVWSGWSVFTTCSVTCGAGIGTEKRTCTNPAPANGGAECVGGSTRTHACYLQHCPVTPVNGDWSDWSVWTSCSVTCGAGTRTEKRFCNNPAPAHGGGDCVGDSVRYSGCWLQHCDTVKVDGVWSDWSIWTTCSVTCGAGTATEKRTCTNPAPANGGADCVGQSTRYSGCYLQHCGGIKIDGRWSIWTVSSPCSVTCGVGTWTEKRTCTNPSPANGGANCVGESTQTHSCNLQACPATPVKGGWSLWTVSSPCSVTCGLGQWTEERTCTNPSPANGGAGCVGESTQTHSCNLQACPATPVNGAWSLWTVSSPCSVTCGVGTFTETRTCTNPAPANGGAGCVGESTQTHSCNLQACPATPVNGAWSLWTVSSPCSVTCGVGTWTEKRTCTNPAPANGGAGCVGQSARTHTCHLQECPTTMAVNGDWSSWSVTTACSATCGDGIGTEKRTCTNPAPANGGADCMGESTRTFNCYLQDCPGCPAYCTTRGPYPPTTSGTVFSDYSVCAQHNVNTNRRITGLRVDAFKFVNSISFRYGDVWEGHGDTQGSFTQFLLADDEQITAVNINSDGEYVHRLVFTTNKRVIGPFGTGFANNKPRTLVDAVAPAGKSLRYISGRETVGWAIRSLTFQFC